MLFTDGEAPACDQDPVAPWKFTSQEAVVHERCPLDISLHCHLTACSNPVAHDIDRHFSIDFIWLWGGKSWLRLGTKAGWAILTWPETALPSLRPLPMCCGHPMRVKALSLWLWTAVPLKKHSSSCKSGQKQQFSTLVQIRVRLVQWEWWPCFCAPSHLGPLLKWKSWCLGDLSPSKTPS